MVYDQRTTPGVSVMKTMRDLAIGDSAVFFGAAYPAFLTARTKLRHYGYRYTHDFREGNTALYITRIPNDTDPS